MKHFILASFVITLLGLSQAQMQATETNVAVMPQEFSPVLLRA